MVLLFPHFNDIILSISTFLSGCLQPGITVVIAF